MNQLCFTMHYLCMKPIYKLFTIRYLEMAFTKDTGIRKQDSGRVYQSVALNSVGRDLAWTFLRDQWRNIMD